MDVAAGLLGQTIATTSDRAACQYKSALPALPLSRRLFPSVILSALFPASDTQTPTHGSKFPWRNLKESELDGKKQNACVILL